MCCTENSRGRYFHLSINGHYECLENIMRLWISSLKPTGSWIPMVYTDCCDALWMFNSLWTFNMLVILCAQGIVLEEKKSAWIGVPHVDVEDLCSRLHYKLCNGNDHISNISNTYCQRAISMCRYWELERWCLSIDTCTGQGYIIHGDVTQIVSGGTQNDARYWQTSSRCQNVHIEYR